jgi:hypothetical protein
MEVAESALGYLSEPPHAWANPPLIPLGKAEVLHNRYRGASLHAGRAIATRSESVTFFPAVTTAGSQSSRAYFQPSELRVNMPVSA